MNTDTIKIVKQIMCGEMRHSVVRRRRDGAYWYVAEYRGAFGWLPMTVANQNGYETAALTRYHKSTV